MKANNQINEYKQQALDFATKYGVKMSVSYIKYGKHFHDDKDNRHIFRITLTRNKKRMQFAFGQSIAAGKTKPTLYDVLSCLTKYDIGSYEDFCCAFGYTTPVKRLYNAAVKEYESVCRLFDEGSECFEALCEIQ